MEPTTGIGQQITDGLSGYAAELATVGALGLGFAVTIWGLPKALSFFKKVAK